MLKNKNKDIILTKSATISQTDIRNWQEYRATRTLTHNWWRITTFNTTLENDLCICIKHKLIIFSSNSTLRDLLKTITSHTGFLTSYFQPPHTETLQCPLIVYN